MIGDIKIMINLENDMELQREEILNLKKEFEKRI